MTVEEVYTDAFDARLVAWVETGASPYLNDSSANYITTTTNGVEEGDWAFPASAGSGAISSVKLRLETKTAVLECGDIVVFVWDGSAWQQFTLIISSTSYVWTEVDVSAILNTWAKINGAEVYVKYSKEVNGTYYIRRLTRKVDYTAGGARVASKRLLVGVGL